MLPTSLALEVVTPERQLVTESVSEVQLPGRNGYLGILPGHAPLITELGIGELSYRKGKETCYASVIWGFAEVLPERVVVLADFAERAEEIDVKRARAARDRAEERLRRPSPDTNWDRATLALQRALIRLQVAAKGGVAAAREEHPPVP
jgi:F-type H+-transporting ATPase subunit epsilon